jgi:hypothetical protein
MFHQKIQGQHKAVPAATTSAMAVAAAAAEASQLAAAMPDHIVTLLLQPP